MLWLEQVMPYITNKDGTAKMRWHGFGVTSYEIMKRYPWFSCDSTSWMRAGAMGQIKVPQIDIKERPFMNSKIQVALTKRSGMSASNLHFDSLSPAEQEFVREYLKRINVSFDEASADGSSGVSARQHANLHYWKQVEKEINTLDLRWKPMHPTFI
jgi:hypothetical protein